MSEPDRTHFSALYPDADDQWQSPPGVEVATLVFFAGASHPCSGCGTPTGFLDLGPECFVCSRACQQKFWDEFQAACDRADRIIEHNEGGDDGILLPF